MLSGDHGDEPAVRIRRRVNVTPSTRQLQFLERTIAGDNGSAYFAASLKDNKGMEGDAVNRARHAQR